MSGAKVRLIVAAILFFGWIGWLGYLAINFSRPVVVSRSQMMLATQIIRVKITIENGVPTQCESQLLLGINAQNDRQIPSDTVPVEDIKDALLPNQKPLTESGTYLVPVRQIAQSYRVVSPPNSPEREGMRNRPIVYPDRPDVEARMRGMLSK